MPARLNALVYYSSCSRENKQVGAEISYNISSYFIWQSMELHWQLPAIIVCLQILLSAAFVLQDERKCKYGRIEKLLRIRCYDLDLKEVPQNLKTSVEVSNR